MTEQTADTPVPDLELARIAFTDPTDGHDRLLLITRDTAGVLHPGCDHIAGIDYAYNGWTCRACGHAGQVDGEWAHHQITDTRPHTHGVTVDTEADTVTPVCRCGWHADPLRYDPDAAGEHDEAYLAAWNTARRHVIENTTGDGQ